MQGKFRKLGIIYLRRKVGCTQARLTKSWPSSEAGVAAGIRHTVFSTDFPFYVFGNFQNKKTRRVNGAGSLRTALNNQKNVDCKQQEAHTCAFCLDQPLMLQELTSLPQPIFLSPALPVCLAETHRREMNLSPSLVPQPYPRPLPSFPLIAMAGASGQHEALPRI